MSDVVKQFLQTVGFPMVLALTVCHMLLWLAILSFPANYAVASLPLWIALAFWQKEMRRRLRLGFAHDRVREISEEQMKRAFDEIEKELKKNKPLP